MTLLASPPGRPDASARIHARRCPLCRGGGARGHCPRCDGTGYLETRGYETARSCGGCSRIFNPAANPTARQAALCLFCRDGGRPVRSAGRCLACRAPITDPAPTGRPRLYCRVCSPARLPSGRRIPNPPAHDR